MARILFFDTPDTKNVYVETNVKVAAPSYPNLTLATLAGGLIAEHQVRIVDLDLALDPYKSLLDAVGDFKPDIVAATASTPVYVLVKDMMGAIKQKYPSITTVVGGVHVTALPGEASAEKCFDVVVLGEADAVLSEILNASSLKEVPGIMFREPSSGQMVATAKRTLIADLNALPYPAWPLFELEKYKNSRISARKNPVGLIETSRGCAYQCNYCNKLTFGSTYRTKNPKRVVDEMHFMIKCGFREIHVIDDSFTQDIGRAKEICREIKRRDLRFPWASISGVRVDKVDYEFFKLAKEAGCWQIGFGIESGDQDVLDRVKKKVTLSDTEAAVKLARKSGIDTFGFFILALAGETEDSMKRTIRFAKRLPLDIAKFDICIPYPGTPYYKELKTDGRIRSENWSKYSCHQIEEPLFEHPNLSWPTIRRYYKTAFRRFYLRPRYIARRFLRSLMKGDLIYDFKYFMDTRW